MAQSADIDEEERVEIVLSRSSLALLAVTAVLLAAVLASGALYELLILLTLPLQPVRLSLVSEQALPHPVVSVTVCVADWLRADELQLVMISPHGRIVYQSGVRTGSDGCMAVAVELREAEEGVYTVAIVRRGTFLSSARFQVSGQLHP